MWHEKLRFDFSYKDKPYYVLVTYEDQAIEARAYHKDGPPANSFKATAKLGPAMDTFSQDDINAIVAEAKNSVAKPPPRKLK